MKILERKVTGEITILYLRGHIMLFLGMVGGVLMQYMQSGLIGKKQEVEIQCG